jgi:hypothetical protein
MQLSGLLMDSERIRATDAKEVGVKNPAEETFCHPNQIRENLCPCIRFVNTPT